MLCRFNEIQREDARIWSRILSTPGLYQAHVTNQDWSTRCFAAVVSLFPHVPSARILLHPPWLICWQWVFWSRDHILVPWPYDAHRTWVRATEQDSLAAPARDDDAVGDNGVCLTESWPTWARWRDNCSSTAPFKTGYCVCSPEVSHTPGKRT